RFYEGNKWGFFPSMALSWNLTNETFMANQQLFDLAKLRFGYGSVGNQNIPNYAFYSLYNPVYSNESVSFVSSGVRVTPNLIWEKQDQFNVDIDLALFDDRLLILADYFDIVNSNILKTRNFSTITRYKSAIENIGEMNNRVIELTVNATLIENDDFNWNIA